MAGSFRRLRRLPLAVITRASSLKAVHEEAERLATSLLRPCGASIVTAAAGIACCWPARPFASNCSPNPSRGNALPRFLISPVPFADSASSRGPVVAVEVQGRAGPDIHPTFRREI